LRDGTLVGLSVQESVEFWAGLNQCSETGTVAREELPDLDPDDGSTVLHLSITGCANDTQVQYYSIIGGGHTWPGRPFTVDFELGALNRDIDATRIIWEWLDSLPAEREA
jgi:polyhydroxybutyrate depolymerase